MTTERKLGIITVGFLIIFFTVLHFWRHSFGLEEFTIERDVITPAPSQPPLLADDKLSDKNPTFDPQLIDSRHLQRGQSFWIINSSAAVMSLDIENTLNSESAFNRLYPNYLAAATALQGSSTQLLPSVNLLAAKGKQFDDGLMGALVLALYSPKSPSPDSPYALLLSLQKTLPAGSEAHAWCSVALDLAGAPDMTLSKTAQQLRADFLARTDSEPRSFYEWSDDLQCIWHSARFIQQELNANVTRELRKSLNDSPSLLANYKHMLSAHTGLDNPASLSTLGQPDGRHFLSPMQTKENILFTKLFGTSGLPQGVDLMEEFIKAIRSGRIDLAPAADSGWYDYQVYALETFLLPERGPENQKLLLTRKYKERLLEAFRAILTKHRETHEMLAVPAAAVALMDEVPRISPRLRLEPNPTSYLRYARSYAFLENLLPTILPETHLKSLHGLKENGPREQPLLEELAQIKNLFYGFHLLACEDIGLKPSILTGEISDARTLMDQASSYLTGWQKDPDLAIDTRVATPVFEQAGHYRNWCVLGVRPIKLEASYVVPPSGQPSHEAGPGKPWIRLGNGGPIDYLLLVDEFCEATTSVPLSRSRLRKICNQNASKADIIKTLSQ